MHEPSSPSSEHVRIDPVWVGIGTAVSWSLITHKTENELVQKRNGRVNGTVNNAKSKYE